MQKLLVCPLRDIAGAGQQCPAGSFAGDVSLRFPLKVRHTAEQLLHPSCGSPGNASLAWIWHGGKGMLRPADRPTMGLSHWNRELGLEGIGGAGKASSQVAKIFAECRLLGFS